MGIQEKDAWYVVVLIGRDESGKYLKTYVLTATSKENAIDRTFKVFDSRLYNIATIFLCGQTEPKECYNGTT